MKLKTRLWDDKKQRYLENNASFHCFSDFMIRAFNGEIVDVVGIISNKDSIYKNDERYLSIYEDINIEVWTGLYHINEVEIYEGDIVRFFAPYETEFCFKDDILKGEISFNDGRFYVKGWGCFNFDISKLELKIVGNIHFDIEDEEDEDYEEDSKKIEKPENNNPIEEKEPIKRLSAEEIRRLQIEVEEKKREERLEYLKSQENQVIDCIYEKIYILLDKGVSCVSISNFYDLNLIEIFNILKSYFEPKGFEVTGEVDIIFVKW